MGLFKRVKKTDPKWKTSPWYIKYRDHDGQYRYECACTDKSASEELLRKRQGDALRRKRGLIDPHEERLAAQSARPIEHHLTEFETSLRAKNNSAGHTRETVSGVREALKATGTTSIREIDATRIVEYLEGLRSRKKRPIGLRSFNKRLKACKSFGAWLVKERRLPTNPLAHCAPVNERVDPRHKRRALTQEEVSQLLQAAERGHEIEGLTGPDRAILYRVALGTGLRRSELASLTPQSFDLSPTTRDANPAVIVLAAYTKNRKPARQEITRDLADALRAYLANKPKRRELWTLPQDTAEMFRVDLANAGIPYENESGEFVDFHALRHTYITFLAAARFPMVVVREMARHQSVTTTERYAHVRYIDRARALDALAGLGGLANTPERAARTGTDDAPAASETNQPGTNHEPSLTLHPSPSPDESAQHQAQRIRCAETHREASPRTHSGTESTGSDSRKSHRHRDLPTKKPSITGGPGSEADGTRTRNHRIDSQAV